MTDYVLNVAVGISAGVGALISAVPNLQPYTLTLCLAVLTLLTLVNLRGIGEAGRLFMLPTSSPARDSSGASCQGSRRGEHVATVACIRQRLHRDDGC